MARSLIPESGQTPVRRMDPFRVFRNEVERLFDSFDWRNRTLDEISPRIDICETDSELDIDAELPGLEEKDIDVTLAGDVLTIQGEKKSEREQKEKNYYVSERSYGSFSRSIPLPFDADPAKVTAKFDKGVLHIAIPKPPEAKAKSAKIQVKPG